MSDPFEGIDPDDHQARSKIIRELAEERKETRPPSTLGAFGDTTMARIDTHISGQFQRSAWHREQADDRDGGDSGNGGDGGGWFDDDDDDPLGGPIDGRIP